MRAQGFLKLEEVRGSGYKTQTMFFLIKCPVGHMLYGGCSLDSVSVIEDKALIQGNPRVVKCTQNIHCSLQLYSYFIGNNLQIFFKYKMSQGRHH